MRLLLFLVGSAALVAVGWICWRATAETREWREFLALGTKQRPSDDERDRVVLLGRKFFPDEHPAHLSGVAILDGPDRRRVLVTFRPLVRHLVRMRLHVLDEDGRRRSSGDIPSGPCGVAFRAFPDRGPWAFDLLKLTPAGETVCPYRLVDDRPVPVGADRE
jgi:hypothetical protein